jgi:hypothetical protein
MVDFVQATGQTPFLRLVASLIDPSRPFNRHVNETRFFPNDIGMLVGVSSVFIENRTDTNFRDMATDKLTNVSIDIWVHFYEGVVVNVKV